jgi:hypothetical protein
MIEQEEQQAINGDGININSSVMVDHEKRDS